MAKRAWYESKTGNHQGLVIEEGTGRNVAVAYDKADAPLIAAAPDLLAALVELVEALALDRLEDGPLIGDAYKDRFADARAAIEKAGRAA